MIHSKALNIRECHMRDSLKKLWFKIVLVFITLIVFLKLNLLISLS